MSTSGYIEEIDIFLKKACTICREIILDYIDDLYTIDSKIVCGDCYYKELGKLVEERPQ